jgi:hypothetical protein
MKVSSKRQGEIAHAVVKAVVRREGVENLLAALDDLESISQKVKVPVPELKAYCEIVLHDLVEDHFAEEAK